MEGFNVIKKNKECNTPFYEVIIVADENDADYVTTKETYSEEEFQKITNAIWFLINKCSGEYKLEEYSKYLIYDEIEQDYCYFTDYLELPRDNAYCEVCHTLKNVDIRYYDNNGVMYYVDIQLKDGYEPKYRECTEEDDEIDQDYYYYYY